MSSIAVCTDASALLADAEAERLGVLVVPVRVVVDGEQFSGDADLFYELLAAGARATTSQPSPGDFLEAFARAGAAGASEVLTVHLDARLSGTVRAAELAVRESPLPVTVVDTGTASFGVGLCARTAARAVAAGATANEAGVVVRWLASTLRNVFVAPSAPRGRVEENAGFMVLELVDGETRPVVGASSPEEAIALIAERIVTADHRVCAAVGHAASEVEAAADELARIVGRSKRVVAVERYRVGPAVGAHTGPGSFGAFSWPVNVAHR